ncbi:hypothetical protein WN55_07014 [Dufourea novaeangliae]|uniref:Uncharacterized protein n=1 Tax=Dufourea novaeangliae TaxID=178035 RepID=A0A154PR74_DUFNO|nr:hypothetical protein WN55_07014 [Dufourea novaeangliae]
MRAPLKVSSVELQNRKQFFGILWMRHLLRCHQWDFLNKKQFSETLWMTLCLITSWAGGGGITPCLIMWNCIRGVDFKVDSINVNIIGFL